jgi:hypothetical protein
MGFGAYDEIRAILDLEADRQDHEREGRAWSGAHDA